MVSKIAIFIKLLFLQYSVLQLSDKFDFFYFVQNWPGSLCDTKRACCYPKTGKPAVDFGIHGLWPNYNNGKYPSNCDRDSVFNKTQISDLISSLETNWPTLACPTSDGIKFWTHEWIKHGTCSESQLDQHDYFQAALKLKTKVDLLQILINAGIKPNDKFYDYNDIKNAIEYATGFTPGIECNIDSSRNSQLFQIYMCVDSSGREFIKCPILPRGRCDSSVQFPKF